jgi:hypothetical protein
MSLQRLPNSKRKIVWTRVGARFMFVNDVAAFIISVYTNTFTHESLILHLSRIFCYAFLFAIYVTRKHKYYYLPIFNEMTDVEYWGVGTVILSVVRLVVTGSSVQYGTPLQALDVVFSSFAIGFVFTSYVRRNWTAQVESHREKRINRLLRKAGISQLDFELVKDDLVQAVKMKQKSPPIWNFAIWMISTVIAVMINGYASSIAEQIRNSGIEFKNILPPY